MGKVIQFPGKRRETPNEEQILTVKFRRFCACPTKEWRLIIQFGEGHIRCENCQKVVTYTKFSFEEQV